MSLIFIVDDNEADRSQLAAIAEASGHDVAEAASGEQALQALQELTPDVLILDVELSGLGGFDVLEQLRRSPRTESLRVIMVGDSVSPKARARAQQLDVVDILPKPVANDAMALRLKWALKSGSATPALGWENADAEAAKARGGIDGDLKKIMTAASKTAAADYHGREGEFVTEVTPELGGSLETPDGDHSAVIPRGAVPTEVGLHLKPSSTDNPIVPEAGTLRLRLGNKILDVRISDRTGAGITGMELGQPARIGITPDPDSAALTGDEVLQEYDQATGEWLDVPTTVDHETGEVYTEKSRVGPVGRRRARVLIVEPGLNEAEKMRVALEGIGCRVSFEEVEAQVPIRIVNDRPSIVILGIGVAGQLGARLMRKIKSELATEYVTLIVISHPKDKDGYADALTLGVRDVIRGPVQMGELQYRVSRAYKSILEKRKIAAHRAKALQGQSDAPQRAAPTKRAAPSQRSPSRRPVAPQQVTASSGDQKAALQRAPKQALKRRPAGAGDPMPTRPDNPGSPVTSGGGPRQKPRQRPAGAPKVAGRQPSPAVKTANPARRRRSA